MPSKILGLFYVHENKVLQLVTRIWCERFAVRGYHAEVIDLSAPDGLAQLEHYMESGEIAFCFGLQGVGSRLTMRSEESLWTHYKTPFLGLHHDSPCCNIYNHFCDSRFVANIYFFQCQYDAQLRFVKNNQMNEHLPFKIEWMPPPDDNTIPFAERPIRLSFIKSGQSPTVFADQINHIKPPLRDAVWAAIEKAEKDENLSLEDLLTEAFTSCGFDPAQFWREFWGFAGWMDNYIRSSRAAKLVNWLKDQEGAVIIGNGWDFIDKTNTKAVFKPNIEAEQAFQIYRESQFTFNASPYGRDIIHERVFSGLGFHSFVISDTNRWWDDNFDGVPSLHRFHWQDDLNGLKDVIHDPLASEKVHSGIGAQRVRERLCDPSTIPSLIGIVDRVRMFGNG